MSEEQDNDVKLPDINNRNETGGVSSTVKSNVLGRNESFHSSQKRGNSQPAGGAGGKSAFNAKKERVEYVIF